jgi:hypothetical protein
MLGSSGGPERPCPITPTGRADGAQEPEMPGSYPGWPRSKPVTMHWVNRSGSEVSASFRVTPTMLRRYTHGALPHACAALRLAADPPPGCRPRDAPASEHDDARQTLGGSGGHLVKRRASGEPPHAVCAPRRATPGGSAFTQARRDDIRHARAAQDRHTCPGLVRRGRPPRSAVPPKTAGRTPRIHRAVSLNVDDARERAPQGVRPPRGTQRPENGVRSATLETHAPGAHDVITPDSPARPSR